MKILIIISALFSFSLSAASIDKVQAKQMSDLAKTYEVKRKSDNPDRGVAFISNRLNTKYLDLMEVDIDKSDMVNQKLRFNRPMASTKKKVIDSCFSEYGTVAIFDEYIVVSGVRKFPVRVKCTGEAGNYREVYTTFKQ